MEGDGFIGVLKIFNNMEALSYICLESEFICFTYIGLLSYLSYPWKQSEEFTYYNNRKRLLWVAHSWIFFVTLRMDATFDFRGAVTLALDAVLAVSTSFSLSLMSVVLKTKT